MPPTYSASSRPNAQRPPRANHGRSTAASNVPPWNRIAPGISVSIVLKADQPTGRQVQGVVQDVLTRHDHPRGVKVRLTDGRVGRVQRLVETAQLDGGAGPAGTSDDLATTSHVQQPTSTRSLNASQNFKYRDVRLDDMPEEPPATHDLAAYIKPARQKKRRGGAPADAPDHSSQTGDAVCPVCQDFRGDEAAVAFHVEGHFG